MGFNLVRMGPRVKYEDTVYEKIEYSGKIFMYNSKTWNVLYPIVNCIRLLKPNTIIGHSHGKNQNIVPLYGRQYNHLLIGYDLKTKKDFLNNLKAVKNIFIFSDEEDITATNIMNASTKNKINVICYSNIDAIYHFYDNINNEKFEFKQPEQVIEKMYTLLDLEGARKIADLFPDFEIIEPVNEIKYTCLEQCSKFLKEQREINENNKKQRQQNYTKVFDPHLNKLKKMEYDRSQKNIVYTDSMELLAKKEADNRKSLLSKFFFKSKS
jgi:hypothetical protein